MTEQQGLPGVVTATFNGMVCWQLMLICTAVCSIKDEGAAALA